MRRVGRCIARRALPGRLDGLDHRRQARVGGDALHLGLGGEHHAVAQGRGHERLHVLGHDVLAPGEQGPRLGRPKEGHRRAGAAQRLVERLNLQGVVQMAGASVAYIRVDEGQVKSVRKGEKILDLAVDKVEPGKVTLSLEGVVVELSH